MANDMKSGIGFLIPGAGVIGFFTSLLLGEFLISIIIAISGILVWFLYMIVMESHMPEEMGNMIILFGILLSLGSFFGFGAHSSTNISEVKPIPLEIALSNGDTFSITSGYQHDIQAYNIIIIPEAG